MESNIQVVSWRGKLECKPAHVVAEWMIEPEVGSKRLALTLVTLEGKEISFLLQELDAQDIGKLFSHRK